MTLALSFPSTKHLAYGGFHSSTRDHGSVRVVVLYFMPTFSAFYFGVQMNLVRLLESLRGSIRQQIDEAEREEGPRSAPG